MGLLALTAVLWGCPGDDPDDAADEDTGADTSAETSAETGATPDVSYAACDDPELGCAGEDCRERTVEGADWSVCVPPCSDDNDCPPAPGSNTPPSCVDERCILPCSPGVAVCPSGTTCTEGDPSQCMWPAEPGVATLEELCTAACDGCMAGMLLGWTEDCPTDCANDLADCSDEELAEALECPGDATCSVGGLTLNTCLSALACKDKSGT